MSIQTTPPNNRKGVIAHRVIAATETATTITLATNRAFMMIQNIGTSVAYIGATNVTTASFGAYLLPKQTYDFGNVDSGFQFGVIMSSGLATNVGVIENA